MSLKYIVGLVVIIVAGAAGYVLYTLESGEEIHEASPLDQKQSKSVITEEQSIRDNLETMDKTTMEDFTKQVKAMQNVVMEKEEPMPELAKLVSEGVFMKRFHAAEGKALLIERNDEKILRFEDFKTDNGPNLHIYLAADLSANDFIDLGKILATKGDVNYEIPSGTDTLRYNKVLVWCVPFGVLFSYAELL